MKNWKTNVCGAIVIAAAAVHIIFPKFLSSDQVTQLTLAFTGMGFFSASDSTNGGTSTPVTNAGASN